MPITVGYDSSATNTIHQAYSDKRAVQAAFYLCKKSEGRIHYVWLLKMLYLADRISLVAKGRPITYDWLCSLDNGPLPSTIYNRIKPLVFSDSHEPLIPDWAEAFQAHGRFFLDAVNDPGVDLLSVNNLKVLDEAFEIAASFDGDWPKFKRYLHRLPEYSDPSGSMIPINYEDILQATNFSEYDIKRCLTELEFDAKLQQLSSL